MKLIIVLLGVIAIVGMGSFIIYTSREGDQPLTLEEAGYVSPTTSSTSAYYTQAPAPVHVPPPTPTPSPTPTPTPTPSPTYIYEETPPIFTITPTLSPSYLQLALFAHMAFFPFDFNGGDLPASPLFTPFHYRPFTEVVMAQGEQNVYGFSFKQEMEGWQLVKTYTHTDTGFSVTLYGCEDLATIVIALRGTYGDMGNALLNQTGTWWCNFNSLAGQQHSHRGQLLEFLHQPDVYEILRGSAVYITGHSLGGYLAYVATLELANMGLESNIGKVVAFSAPIFSQQMLRDIRFSISPVTRRRITHFYVEGDLIAGAVGIDVGNAPDGYSVFGMFGRILNTLGQARGMYISSSMQSLVNAVAAVENILPMQAPAHIVDMLWILNGTMSQEAYAITAEFSRLVRHVPVPQTWQSPRPSVTASFGTSPLEIIRNYSPEFMMEVMAYLIQGIFDPDTHFMMNFYDHLVW